MIYFFRFERHIPKGEDSASILLKLKSKFEVEQKKEDFFLKRERIAGNRGILRMIFPKLVTKLTIERETLKFKSRFDGAAFFFLVMFIGGVVVEFTMDRATYPREYPFWVPILFTCWYVGFAIFEFLQVKKNIQELIP